MTFQLESRISYEAGELLDCFSGGIAEVVRDLAEAFARERLASPDDPIEIDEQDVRKAGEILIRSIRDATARGRVPPHVSAAIGGMSDCFLQKTR